jgi:hypothetical protein
VLSFSGGWTIDIVGYNAKTIRMMQACISSCLRIFFTMVNGCATISDFTLLHLCHLCLLLCGCIPIHCSRTVIVRVQIRLVTVMVECLQQFGLLHAIDRTGRNIYLLIGNITATCCFYSAFYSFIPYFFSLSIYWLIENFIEMQNLYQLSTFSNYWYKHRYH